MTPQGGTRRRHTNYFGVYVFHAPIIVAGALLARGINLPPLAKMYVMAILLVPVCFVVTRALRQIAWVRRYFT